MKFLFVLCSLIVVSWAQSCGKADIEPLSGRELNADGTISGSGVRHNTQGIVNGDVVKKHSIPWQVELSIDMGDGTASLCGGSILNENWILTAAHCIASQQGRAYTIKFGQHNRNPRSYESSRITCKASQVVSHSGYDSTTMANDIALLRVDRNSCDKPLRFSSEVQPVCLPAAGDVFGKDKTFGMVSGWGTTSSEGDVSTYLQKTVVEMHTNSDCATMIRKIQPWKTLAAGSLCGSGVNSKGKTDSCQGDSGGPLVMRTTDGTWRLAGVVSWGFGCADTNAPGVYTDVPKFLTWIKSKTGISGSTTAMTSGSASPTVPTGPSGPSPSIPSSGGCSAGTLEVGETTFMTKDDCSVFEQLPVEAQKLLNAHLSYISRTENRNGCFKIVLKASNGWRGPQLSGISLKSRC